MLHLRFENWSVVFPEEWNHEIADDILAIATPTEGGTLQIGSMSKDEGPVSEEDLWEFMEDAGVDASDIDRVTLGDFAGLAAASEDDGVLLRYWVLRAGDVLLLSTFRCPAEQGDSDIAAVETVLKSLKHEVEAAEPPGKPH